MGGCCRFGNRRPAMTSAKTLIVGMALLAGWILIADAQAQYPAYLYSPDNQARSAPVAPPRPSVDRSSPVWLQPSVPVPTRPAVPPGWNYDPYTNGTVPAPQRGGE